MIHYLSLNGQNIPWLTLDHFGWSSRQSFLDLPSLLCILLDYLKSSGTSSKLWLTWKWLTSELLNWKHSQVHMPWEQNRSYAGQIPSFISVMKRRGELESQQENLGRCHYLSTLYQAFLIALFLFLGKQPPVTSLNIKKPCYLLMLSGMWNMSDGFILL